VVGSDVVVGLDQIVGRRFLRRCHPDEVMVRLASGCSGRLYRAGIAVAFVTLVEASSCSPGGQFLL
jgi:hypothetical protein